MFRSHSEGLDALPNTARASDEQPAVGGVAWHGGGWRRVCRLLSSGVCGGVVAHALCAFAPRRVLGVAVRDDAAAAVGEPHETCEAARRRGRRS